MGSLLEERGMALEERDEACACIKREMLETADDDAGATRGVGSRATPRPARQHCCTGRGGRPAGDVTGVTPVRLCDTDNPKKVGSMSFISLCCFFFPAFSLQNEEKTKEEKEREKETVTQSLKKQQFLS